MPSAEHESPVALATLNPDLVAWIMMNLFDVKGPDVHHARTHATDIRVMVPRTYHADSVVLLCDQADRPMLAAVLEVQRGRDPAKQRTWKLYLAQLEAELGVNAGLLVYCPDPAVARWYSSRLDSDEGLSLLLRPMIFTPDMVPVVTDAELARANPALAVFSAICHGGHAEVDGMFPALAAALQAVGPNQAILYYDVVLAGLPAAARVRWEEFMATTVEEYRSEMLRNLAAQHEERGEARGEGRAVLTVLDARGIPVPAEVREQILTCSDLAQLETWLRRAVTATTVDDLLGGQVSR